MPGVYPDIQKHEYILIVHEKINLINICLLCPTMLSVIYKTKIELGYIVPVLAVIILV